MIGRTDVAALRALAWKEWREQRSLVAAGLALAILIPLLLMAGTAGAKRPIDASSLAGILTGIYVMMLWPLMAAAAGAATIANEIGEGTLGFLLSRPASRARLWAVKVAMAFLSGLAVLAGAMVVAVLFGRMAGTSPALDSSAAFLASGVEEDAVLALLIVPAACLLFATSVFFSTFLPRAMTAAAAGVAAALLVIGGLFLIWSRLDLAPRLEPIGMALDLFLAALLVLAASFYLFTRGELLRGLGARRLAGVTAVAVVGCLGLVSVPLIELHGRLTPATAALHGITPSGSGDLLLAAASREDGRAPQVWLIHADGTGMERLAGSLTFSPAFSPDGHRVAYFSRRGLLGLSTSETGLRVVRVDGSEDRRLATLTDWFWMTPQRVRIVFSPDGARVAALGGGRLTIARATGAGEPGSIDLTGTELMQGSLAGWSADGKEVLALSDGGRWSRDGASVLAAVDADSGRIRPLYRAPDRTFIWLPHDRPRGWTQVPIVVEGDLLLVDTRTGSAEMIAPRAAYWSPRITDDGALLAYAVRRGPRQGPGESEIHLRELGSGADRILATVPGLSGDILISPTRDILVVNRYAEGKPIASVTVTSDGRVNELPLGWTCLGWQGRERILLAEASDSDPRRLAVRDMASGEMRPIYP